MKIILVLLLAVLFFILLDTLLLVCGPAERRALKDEEQIEYIREWRRKKMITRVLCKKCAHDFPISQTEHRIRIIDEKAKVLEEFFCCPNCGAKYTILITDPELGELIATGRRRDAYEYERTLREKYADKLVEKS